VLDTGLGVSQSTAPAYPVFMAYRNIYDLGTVDLYVDFGDGALVPVADAPLAGGTIQEVNGVVQCRNLPSTAAPNNPIRIVAVPLFTRSSHAAARLTTSAVNMPQDDEFATFSVRAGVNPQAVDVTLTPVFEGGICTSFSDEQPVAIGALPAAPGSGDDLSGLTFRFGEDVS